MEVVKSNVLDRLKSEAQREIEIEFEAIAKNRIKNKLREIKLAKQCLKNLENELEDLYLDVSISE